MTTPIPVFVFSFNRPDFLRNSLASIRLAMPESEIFIFDDNSFDVDTKKVLKEEQERSKIYYGSIEDVAEFKTGGLYGLMNFAMQIAREQHYKIVLFIQDDMQMVRSVSETDVDHISAYFESVPNTIQLSTTFIRRLGEDSFFDDHVIMHSASAYIRKTGTERGKSNFSATGIFSVERFFKFFESFEAGEGRNSQKALERGLTCGRTFFPFMNWLPYPTSFRGRRRNLKHLLFESLGRSGFYPIEFMSEFESRDFLSRDPCILPIMENFLRCPTAPRHDIWSTGGGEYNFVVYGSLPARLFVQARMLRSSLRRRIK